MTTRNIRKYLSEKAGGHLYFFSIQFFVLFFLFSTATTDVKENQVIPNIENNYGSGRIIAAPGPYKQQPGFQQSQAKFQPQSIRYSTTASDNHNYVIKYNIKKPGVTDPSQIGALAVSEKEESISYLDDIGRPVQSVITKGSAGQQDMVVFKTFDNAGRENKTYLPYTSGNDGSFKSNALTAQASFYQSLKGDNLAYAETKFDNSPLNRVVEQGAPGASWQISTGHTKKMVYGKNGANEVRVWNYNSSTKTATGTSYYAANELNTTQQTDEQGLKSIEYKNKNGQVVCKKLQKILNDDNSYIYTYYVYDDAGNMRYSIPPEGINRLAGISYTFSYNDVFTKEWLNSYDYDPQMRVIVKRAPGAGEEYLIYDSKDRVVFSQDAAIRLLNQWQTTLYDAMNRVVITGLMTLNISQTDLQNAVNTQTATPANPNTSLLEDIILDGFTSGTQSALHSITMVTGFESSTTDFTAQIVAGPGGSDGETTFMEGVRVNKNPIPSATPFTVLTVNYYDNYDWVTESGSGLSITLDASNTGNSTYFMTSYNSSPLYAQPITASYHTRGRATGIKSRILGTNQFNYTVSFYDDQGRVIQVQNTNLTGGKDLLTTQYDFSGKILRLLEQQQKSGTNAQSSTILTKYDYDHAGRCTKIWKNIDNSGDHAIGTYTFNELGEKTSKVLGNSLTTMDYEYNIRGWLSTINKNFVQSADNPVATTGWFGMELGYDNSTSVVSNTSYTTPQFNGGISGTVWKTRGSGVKRKYDYTYDNTGKLISANFKQQFGASWANTDPSNSNFSIDFSISGKGSSNQYIEYDDNGNIKNLRQKGLKLNSSPLIDDLDYEYVSGNHLNSVTDAVSVDVNVKLGDFINGTNTGNDYHYDNNGNLDLDKNKKITSITYNHLALPVVITFTKDDLSPMGTITYTYDAQGNKLKKVIEDKSVPNVTVTTTDTYLNGAVYESRQTNPVNSGDYAEKLLFIPHEEGRARWVPASPGPGGSFVYERY